VTLVLATLTAFDPTGRGEAQRVVKSIDITSKDGKLMFLEQGKEEPGVVTLVVGETVRWHNKDARAHRIVSDLKVEGKPLFDTEVIQPREHKDMVIKFDMYRKAGGRPASVIKLKYHSTEQERETGELQVLSAARR
jgi:plastocyanin